MLAFNASEREIYINGTITLPSGVVIDISAQNIMHYSISERIASNGLALGEAQSATYNLEIDNTEHRLKASELEGAAVVVKISSIRGTSISIPIAFGVWTVSSASVSEQSVTATLSGGDALEFNFDAKFAKTDQVAGANANSTHGSLLQYVCNKAGVTLATTDFLHSTTKLTGNEKWPDDITLRDVVSYIAAAAGGFARIARDGTLEIVSYVGQQSAGTITADTYITLNEGEGAAFRFRQIAVKHIGEDTMAYYPLTEFITEPGNTLQVIDNPLFNSAIATTVGTHLTELYAEPISVEWVGDPTLRLGDVVTVRDIDDVEHSILVNSQVINYDGGLYATTECRLPKKGDSSSGYTKFPSRLQPSVNVGAIIDRLELPAISRGDEPPTDPSVGDLWVLQSNGEMYQCSSVAADDVAIPETYLDGDNFENLYYTLDDEQNPLSMYINADGELIYENVTYQFNIDADGCLVAASEVTWDEVNKGLVERVNGLSENIVTKKELDYYMRLDADNGVEIGRSEAESKLVLTNEGVNMKVNGETFSRFTGDYAQFGDYQIRKSTRGALVFKLAKKEGEGLSALSLR